MINGRNEDAIFHFMSFDYLLRMIYFAETFENLCSLFLNTFFKFYWKLEKICEYFGTEKRY